MSDTCGEYGPTMSDAESLLFWRRQAFLLRCEGAREDDRWLRYVLKQIAYLSDKPEG